MTEYLIRFVVGGVIVSAFAMIGDVLRPKSFAGLFGAAPSVALATLGVAVVTHGAAYAAVQSRSMMFGAVALCLYSVTVCQLLMRLHLRALTASLLATVVWLVAAFGLQAIFSGGA
ncbi:conserved membrane protein of unknown function [Bradyrhizobium sp. ORS 285]|uniref:DUF3147 family protein n=1 Tax=Bradyrhizobium sp. ORS 285 TaxID=115808 RepID=UPI0002409502|nr:DUF3147 family protein [Bradyrhizobium sp. ORS 285]CCD87503.1 conserved membrane hypothetical protein [Bradyrhizobium sp. ORS 285]SMX60344.1 conserved membrane protein of unknown function [Bradyrhizobium sp. ORS 285]